MDDQQKADGQSGHDMNLGGGVDIVTSQDDLLDDIQIESYNDDVMSGGEITPEDHIKRLRDKIREITAEKQEYLDGWQRSKADYANYRKREEESKGEFLKFAREGIITDLLPILESFHMAFSNKDAWAKVDPSWRTGVEYIHTQLLQTLAGHGLTEIDPTGEPFNPNEHTSIGTVPTDDASLDHKVAEVAQLGYRMHGKLIRSPRVKIYAKE